MPESQRERKLAGHRPAHAKDCPARTDYVIQTCICGFLADVTSTPRFVTVSDAEVARVSAHGPALVDRLAYAMLRADQVDPYDPDFDVLATAALDLLAAEGRLCEPQMGVVIPDGERNTDLRRAFVEGADWVVPGVSQILGSHERAKAEARRRWPEP